MRRSMNRVSAGGILAVILMVLVSGPVFSETGVSQSETAAAQIIARNNEKLASLAGKFSAVSANHAKMMAGIKYLRIRSHKKGGVSLTDEQEKLNILAADLNEERKARNFKAVNKFLDNLIKETEGSSYDSEFKQAISDFLSFLH